MKRRIDHNYPMSEDPIYGADEYQYFEFTVLRPLLEANRESFTAIRREIRRTFDGPHYRREHREPSTRPGTPRR
eukprot:12910728-Prorocentrum_lima.AAC.1